MTDLWSPTHWEQKAWKRVADAKPQDFECWEEAKARYTETKIEPLLARYRQDDQDWFADWNRRKGEMMHSSDLIFRLQRLNPHLQIQNQVNFPEEWGLYSSALGKIQFLTGFPKGWLTEWSYAILDARNLPVEEKRGWRTVLVYLILKGAVNLNAAIRAFGEPKDGWNDYRWQETLADFRHGGEEMVHRNIANLLE